MQAQLDQLESLCTLKHLLETKKTIISLSETIDMTLILLADETCSLAIGTFLLQILITQFNNIVLSLLPITTSYVQGEKLYV